MSKNKLFPGGLTPFLMWLLPLAFFTHQFILRLWPGLMMQQILNQFSIDATMFGMLAASYYYGYAGMQIPVAILLDRFSPRIIVFIFAAICGIATIIFTFTDNFYIAIFSRFFIGVGSAAGFLGVSKVVSQWFGRANYSKMIGFSFTIGLLGAIYSGKPIELLIEKHSGEYVAISIGIVSILIGVATYIFLKAPRKVEAKSSNNSLMMDGLKSILLSKLIWVIAISNLLMVGSLEGFADVWGVQYLIMSYNISKSSAAGLVSYIFMGMLVGGPLLAWLSSRIGNYNVLVLCGLGMAVLFAMLLADLISLALLPYCFFAIGTLCCYQVIVFALGSELVSHSNIGICIAFLNSINMLGGSFFHTLIGLIMDICENGKFIDTLGTINYQLDSYKYALSIIPICSAVGATIFYIMHLKIRNANKVEVGLI